MIDGVTARVMSLLSLKDLRESRRHLSVVKVTLSLKAANQRPWPSPKLPVDSNVNSSVSCSSGSLPL